MVHHAEIYSTVKVSDTTGDDSSNAAETKINF